MTRSSAPSRPKPPTPGWPPCSPSTPSERRPSTSPTSCAAPTSRTTSRGTGWPSWSVRGAPASRRCAARSAPQASRSRWPATTSRSSRTRPCCRCSRRCRAAVNIDNDDDESADYVDHGRAESLLLGPLGGLDAGDVRRLARLLRTREKDAAHAESRLPLTSKELTRLAVLRDGFLDAIPGPEAAAARALHTLVRTTADGLAERRHRRGRPVGAVVPHRLARPPAALGRARRGSGPPGAPRPRLHRRAVRGRGPRGREA